MQFESYSVHKDPSLESILSQFNLFRIVSIMSLSSYPGASPGLEVTVFLDITVFRVNAMSTQEMEAVHFP